MKINSTYPNTISFNEEGFIKLIGKEWNTLECTMSDGEVIKLPRYIVMYLWTTSQNWIELDPDTRIKVLKIR